MLNSPKHQGLRNILAKTLQEKGIVDTNVLDAIRQVPRHLFLDSSFESHAYLNKAFPIGADQTISHPYTVAFQTEKLKIKPGDKVLETVSDLVCGDAFIIEGQSNALATDTRERRATARRRRFLILGGSRGGQVCARRTPRL